MTRNTLLFFFLVMLLSILNSHAANAQSVTVINELNFGEAVVTNNSNQHSINLQSNGHFTADSPFIFLQDPKEGLYRVDGLPPLTAITNISITVDQQLMGFGDGFVMDNFDISAPPTSDVNGEIEIYLGARLRTTGTNRNYLYNSVYQGSLTLFINY